MAHSILIMAAGAAGTMAGIIATGIMAAGDTVSRTTAGATVLRTAAAGMAAAATAKSPFEICLALHAGTAAAGLLHARVHGQCAAASHWRATQPSRPPGDHTVRGRRAGHVHGRPAVA